MLRGADDIQRMRLTFDHEEIEDDVEPISGFGGSRKGIKQMTARVAPAACALASVDVGDVVVSRVAVNRDRAGRSSENSLRGVAAARRTKNVDGAKLRKK